MAEELGVAAVFEQCRAQGRAALIGYLPVGYPSVAESIEAMTVMVESGVDIIEVGAPYSDPVIDGPVIQRATAAALAAGTRVDDLFSATRAIRDAGAPPLVMSYWNLVLRRGVDQFAAQLAGAGGAGLITPDLIPDEAAQWIAASDREGLDRVFLVAPSSTPQRLATVVAQCRGFVYAASTMGVTGERASVGSAAADLVARTKAMTDLPVCVGLGVSGGEQAAQIAAYADGVIVGTALLRCLTTAGTATQRLSRLAELCQELSAGVRASSSLQSPASPHRLA